MDLIRRRESGRFVHPRQAVWGRSTVVGERCFEVEVAL